MGCSRGVINGGVMPMMCDGLSGIAQGCTVSRYEHLYREHRKRRFFSMNEEVFRGCGRTCDFLAGLECRKK